MSNDAMLVQRLLCLCLVELEATPIALALEFLMSDTRRLVIGNFEDYYGDSRKLITKITPELDKEHLQQLQQYIRDWTEYLPETLNDPADVRRKRTKWDRECRLRLFLAIPKQVMTDELRAFVEAEEIALPTVKARLEYDWSSSRVSQVKSPMSAEQMEKANDDHILKLFDELTDTTGHDHPRRHMDGGTIDASRELAALAKEDPQRVSILVKRLRSDDQQTPVAHAVRGIGASDYPSSELFDLIENLVKLGFDSHDFQDSVASVCLDRAYKLDGLPDDICDQLKSWIQNWKFPTGESKREDEQYELAKIEEGSVVFADLYGHSIPHGTYSILAALTIGLLRKKPPESEEWLNILDSHLDRPENARTWQVFCLALGFFSNCNHKRSVQFLTNLFAKYPNVRDSRFGVYLIKEIRQFLGEPVFEKLGKQIGTSGWSKGKQVQGELFGYSYIVEDGFNSVDEFVKQKITNGPSGNESLLEGVAHASANLWKYNKCRLRATDVFEQLAEKECPQINRALADVFLFDKFVPNKESRRILQVTVAYPAIIHGIGAYHFAQTLELFASSDPDIVLSLTNRLLDQIESPMRDEHTQNLALADSSLTSIAITLQHMDEKRRKAGLDLFERLLKLGFSATIQSVHVLDNRPVNVSQIVRRRRRRKN